MRRRNVAKKGVAMNIVETPPFVDDVSSDTSIPPEITCDADAVSVDSSTRKSIYNWDQPYVAPPVMDRSTILAAGFGIFVLAMIWPPLILLFAYIASKLIPYSFRENDDAAVRRILYAKFASQDEDHPERFRNIRKYVNLEESYWTNERYVIVTNTGICVTYHCFVCMCFLTRTQPLTLFAPQRNGAFHNHHDTTTQ
jgi:hypothetical protein